MEDCIKRKKESTHGVVAISIVGRHSDGLIGRLHREVLGTETWSLEALSFDVCKCTNGSESLSKTTNFGEDGVDVEAHHALGHGDEFDLTIVG